MIADKEDRTVSPQKIIDVPVKTPAVQCNREKSFSRGLKVIFPQLLGCLPRCYKRDFSETTEVFQFLIIETLKLF